MFARWRAQGEIDVILAYSLDRVSRSQTHLGFLLSEWDHAGVRLALVTEDLEDTPEGRLLQSVRSFVAEVERLKIKERTVRGRRARAESGRLLPGRKPPIGYLWNDDSKDRLVEDPLTAPVVRRLFRDVTRGSIAEIGRDSTFKKESRRLTGTIAPGNASRFPGSCATRPTPAAG